MFTLTSKLKVLLVYVSNFEDCELMAIEAIQLHFVLSSSDCLQNPHNSVSF